MSARSKKKTKSSSIPLNEAMQECLDILKFIQSRDESEPFLKPVDWELYGLNDYPQIISHPMDLGTIETKLDEGKYKDPSSFAADVRLVWDNCMKYNRPDSDLYSSADRLSKLFEKKFSKLRGPMLVKKKVGETGTNFEAVRADRLKFSQMVNGLTPDQLGLLVEMISNQCPGALKEDEQDDIEIEINNIDAATLRNLIAYCGTCSSSQSTDQSMQQASAQKKQKVK